MATAKLDVKVYCPECNWGMTVIDDYITCLNSTHDKVKYQVPTIELVPFGKPVVLDSQPTQTITHTYKEPINVKAKATKAERTKGRTAPNKTA